MPKHDLDLPTEASSASKMPARLSKALVGILMVALLDVALTYAIYPYGSDSEVMWGSYRAHSDVDIDSVIVGTSFAEISLNPYTLDAALGSSTFNMATPSQLFEDSRLAVEQALKDHDIKRVYLGFGYSSLNDGASVSSSVAFTWAKMDSEPFQEQASDFFRALINPAFFGSSKSFGMLFPWTTNHIDYNLPALRENIEKRLTLTPLQAAGAVPGTPVYDKGLVVGYSTFNPSDYVYNVDLYTPTGENFSSCITDALAHFVRYCVANGLEVYVVMPPVPLYNVLRYGSDYPLRMSAIRDTVEMAGGTYLDANMLKQDVYQPVDDDFLDGLHLNEPASEKFASVLADLVSLHEDGEDISDKFFSYEDWSSYLASLDTIALVNFTSSSSSEGVSIDAYVYAGSRVSVEYQFLLANDDGTYQELTDYQPDAHYFLPTNRHGSVSILVNARRRGTSDVERYAEKTVMY